MKLGSRESGIGNGRSKRRGLAGFYHSRFSIPHSRHQKGFSLLEVIAAILLLAIAFTALMKVAGASISLTRNAADHSEAAMWARSRLDSAFVGEPISSGVSSGQFSPKFRWQLRVSPWNPGPAPNAPLNLYQLDLNVMWGPSTHPRSAHFRTLRLGGPLQGGPGAGNGQVGR